MTTVGKCDEEATSPWKRALLPPPPPPCRNRAAPCGGTSRRDAPPSSECCHNRHHGVASAPPSCRALFSSRAGKGGELNSRDAGVGCQDRGGRLRRHRCRDAAFAETAQGLTKQVLSAGGGGDRRVPHIRGDRPTSPLSTRNCI